MKNIFLFGLLCLCLGFFGHSGVFAEEIPKAPEISAEDQPLVDWCRAAATDILKKDAETGKLDDYIRRYFTDEGWADFGTWLNTGNGASYMRGLESAAPNHIAHVKRKRDGAGKETVTVVMQVAFGADPEKNQPGFVAGIMGMTVQKQVKPESFAISAWDLGWID